ncbi:cyclic nucleotide-binding domain-containing protein 2 [Lingula anatina]|uniref:Cyclic nucleotide-binding domain-containing protein 2 n=1 Tax=Lingula anatina TaxID=7574 RepID=A0A1S3JVK5_LINAN|nr:cyclic nucleotide-binding domain-containing protein 2 [Lingula anatina]|eukprot:XP_013414119.1 cyclic nucleotide-binding domain-containing protein 2 [Lingula anatina]
MLLNQPPPKIHTPRFHVRTFETMATTSGGDKSPGRQRINSLYGTLAKASAASNSRRYSHAPQSLGVPSVGVVSDRRGSTQGRHHRGMSMDTAFADISKSVLRGSRKQSTDKSRLGLPLMDASAFGRRRSLRERNRGTSDPTLPASGTEDMGPRKASNKSIKSFSRQLKFVQTLKEKQRLQELMKKFRRAARLAIFCRRQTLAHSLRNKEHDELLPFIRDLKFTDYQDFGTALDVDIWDGFNPNDFKANRQLRLSEEAKRILTKPSGERTEQELNYVEISLRNIKAYSDYTVRMQRKIAEVGMYERFEAKRIIVRQSHPPNAFYILLSGSVVVVVMDQETRVAKPVAILKRGRAFGELGLINRTPRQSSCIAKETVEMLSISIQDFRQIFMTGGDDDEELIEKLDCFNGWPVQILESNPKKLMHHFFK